MMTKDARNRLTVRLPQGLNKRLETEARRIGLSKNAYIVILLSRHVQSNYDKSHIG